MASRYASSSRWEYSDCIRSIRARISTKIQQRVVPDCLRKESITDVILLLPDSNRLALESILRFLHEFIFFAHNISKISIQGLARLFVPSIFHSFPAKIKCKYGIGQSQFFTMRGIHDIEHSSLESCLIFMICHVDSIFQVSKTKIGKINESIKCETLNSMLRNCRNNQLNVNINNLIAEKIKYFFQNVNRSSSGHLLQSVCTNNILVRCFKANHDDSDMCPVLFRASAMIKCEISNIAHCILNDRAIWDTDYSDYRLIEKFEGADIIQYVTKPFNPLPVRSVCEFRYAQWVRSSSECKSGHIRKWLIIGSNSINHVQNRFMPGTMVKVDYSYFLLKPMKGNVVKLKYFYRADLRGCTTSWYSEVFLYKIAKCLNDLKYCCT
ncbi:hypothetical protein GJ496_001923 [Pomphorhynchus laevis]|nr:hypothetical protein GJ496_001923 [Pomphorhynchus laevis]